MSESAEKSDAGKRHVAVIGDTHGHLQLALCVIARWQKEEKIHLDAVFLAGDIGSFTEDGQLDNATRRHARENPCELEFLTQWSASPQPAWLRLIFDPEESGGLGLDCPVIMVHGNHEGFPHLQKHANKNRYPPKPVSPFDLPVVDTDGWIRYLPSGWIVRLPSGHTVAGVGGIEKGQRSTDYHPMAYIDDNAVSELYSSGPVDLLVSHQAPATIQGEDKGSLALQPLLDEEVARFWFHGHSIRNPEIVQAGPNGKTTVVPLGDIAFAINRGKIGDAGEGGWSVVDFSGDAIAVRRFTPGFLREYRLKKWPSDDQGRLVCPDLWSRWNGMGRP